MAFFYKINSDVNITDPNEVQGAGYSVGGYNATSSIINSISAVDYKTGACYTPAVFLTNNRSNSTGLSSTYVGLICGGYDSLSGLFVNDIDGIQFSTETSISISNVLGNSIAGAGPLNGPTVGYLWSGGYGSIVPIESQSTTGVNFSNYSSGVYATRVAVARLFPAGVSSGTAGYGLGGSATTEIDGLTFSTITSLNPAATLPSARNAGVGIDNAITGYHAGGSTSTATNGSGGQSSIHGFDLTGNYVFSVTATLQLPVTFATPANSTVAGYVMGGTYLDGSKLSSIVKFGFNTQTTTLLSSAMSTAHSIGAGVWTRQFHNMTGRSYVNSGYTSYPTASNSTDCIEFSTNTVRQLVTVLSAQVRGGSAGMSAADTGYWAGGYSGSAYLGDIFGIQFSTEAYNSVSATLSFGKSDSASFSSYARGYVYAGNGTYGNSMFGFIFGTETVLNLGNTAFDALQVPAGFAAENSSYGWICGGYTSAAVNYLRGCSLATEVSASSVANLSTVRYGADVIGTSSYTNAYVCNGYNATTWQLSRDYFTHMTSPTSVTTGNSGSNVSTYKYRPTASSSSTRGYLSGGGGSGTSTEYYIFTSGLAGILADSLQQTKEAPTATYVNTLFKNYNLSGFVCGGWLDATNVTSNIIECYDFASEALYRIGTMSTPKANQAAVSSVTAGYLGGGDLTTSTVTDTIDRFIYSTRTYNIAVTYLLSGTRANADGVNSSVKGYFCGGRNATNSAVYARIEGVTFADETYYFPGVSLVNSRFGGTGNNSATVGYLMGGAVDTLATRTRSCETLTFSTEARANTSNVLPSARANLAGTNSSTAAYYMGGDSAPSTAYTTCYKMTFPTLSTVTMTDALDTAKRGAKGLGNEIAGYAMGGANAGLTVSYNTIDKCTYATETIDRRDAVLTTARSRAAALSAI